MAFSQGHALIIGVGKYQHIFNADVPIALDDAKAVARVEILIEGPLMGYVIGSGTRKGKR